MSSKNVSTNGMKYLSSNVALYFFPLLKNKILNEAADTTLDNHVQELNTEDNIVKLEWTPTKT
jgi:hypothetical protein